VAARQKSGVGDVVIRIPLDRETARRRTADEKAGDIAGFVETALRNRDQRPGKRQFGTNTSPSIPLFAGSARSRGGWGIGRPRASRPSLP
jgi:hypothetical protein